MSSSASSAGVRSDAEAFRPTGGQSPAEDLHLSCSRPISWDDQMKRNEESFSFWQSISPTHTHVWLHQALTSYVNGLFSVMVSAEPRLWDRITITSYSFDHYFDHFTFTWIVKTSDLNFNELMLPVGIKQQTVVSFLFKEFIQKLN